MYEYPDEELINLFSENSEEASDILYDKYNYIVDIICNKYKRSAIALNIDFKELKQEALVGFSDALVNYDINKEASLPTFISLCVERKVANYVRNADTIKSKLMKQAYSLDIPIDSEEKLSLLDIIGSQKEDPEFKIEQEESVKEITEKINELLSPNEKEVYELMINGFNYVDIAAILNKSPKQVDNAIQRIRNKLKGIL